jgi:hypothetical protein
VIDSNINKKAALEKSGFQNIYKKY